MTVLDEPEYPHLELLRDRINLGRIPFSDRGSRLLVVSHAQHLQIRLAERWFKREGQLSGYRQRPPIVDEWHLTDGDGNPLPLDVSTRPHCVELRTAVGLFRLAFLDSETLILALPPAPCGITFRASVDKAETDRRGGVLRLVGEIRRSIAYTTNAAILRNDVSSPGASDYRVRLLVSPDDERRALLLNITPRLGLNRYIPDVNEVIRSSALAWEQWFSAAPTVAAVYRPQYYYAWWIMRAGLISTRYYTTREAMTPSKIHYVGVWQWDAFFHALAYRYVDRKLAQDQIRILIDHQREDGMIPDAVHDEGTVTHLQLPVEADVTKPPLMAWAAWKLFEAEADREFLEEIYEPIVRWNQWWFAKNDLDHDGLCEYQHPFSSGLDDSPLWDDGMPVVSPDLNTYLCLQQESMARIAGVLGRDQDRARWEQGAAQLAERLRQELWDPHAGIFWAKKAGQRIDVRTPFNLFPLLTGSLPQEIVRRLVAHLTDPKQFWPRYPVPTVALNDVKHDPDQMWRGPTWVNVNYLLIDGLQRCGYAELARELRRRTLEMVMSQPDIAEYYNPHSGQSVAQAASIYGWSAALFIDLAIRASREESNNGQA